MGKHCPFERERAEGSAGGSQSLTTSQLAEGSGRGTKGSGMEAGAERKVHPSAPGLSRRRRLHLLLGVLIPPVVARRTRTGTLGDPPPSGGALRPRRRFALKPFGTFTRSWPVGGPCSPMGSTPPHVPSLGRLPPVLGRRGFRHRPPPLALRRTPSSR